MKVAIRLALCVLLAPTAALVPTKATELGEGSVAFMRQNHPMSARSLQRQAERGSSHAQAVLCFMYSRGQGVPQNYREAAYWCGRAADQGNPEGQYLLGLMYDKGQGVRSSFPRAYIWLDLAAARVSGNRRDLFYRIRDSVATKMTPDQITVAQRAALEWAPLSER
jgi:TPR repeat protein